MASGAAAVGECLVSDAAVSAALLDAGGGGRTGGGEPGGRTVRDQPAACDCAAAVRTGEATGEQVSATGRGSAGAAGLDQGAAERGHHVDGVPGGAGARSEGRSGTGARDRHGLSAGGARAGRARAVEPGAVGAGGRRSTEG